MTPWTKPPPFQRPPPPEALKPARVGDLDHGLPDNGGLGLEHAAAPVCPFCGSDERIALVKPPGAIGLSWFNAGRCRCLDCQREFGVNLLED